MPRDVSSSSSEDEADTVPAEPQKEKPTESEKKNVRYQCPPDFVSFCHKPCSSALTKSLKKNKNELWLIKAPANFNPECFSSIKVPLSGLHTLKIPSAAEGANSGSGQQIYSILASTHGTSELHLLTSDKQSSNSLIFAPAFSGLLNVCESYGDSSANLAPQVIPAAPAPSIPTGLKQRFQPFGSKTPTLTCLAGDELKGAANPRPLVAKRFIEETGHEEEERKKKKKKRKKEKQIETEQAQVPEVKVEPKAEILNEALTELPFLEGEVSEDRRRRKKKKKDKDREEVDEGVEPSVIVKVEEVTVKCETIDTTYGDEVEGLTKKKKKKKKSKPDDE